MNELHNTGQAATDGELMTVPEVARYLRMSAAWVRQHAGGLRQPIVPSVKMGKAVRFRRSAVVEFVRAMERTSVDDTRGY